MSTDYFVKSLVHSAKRNKNKTKNTRESFHLAMKNAKNLITIFFLKKEAIYEHSCCFKGSE